MGTFPPTASLFYKWNVSVNKTNTLDFTDEPATEIVFISWRFKATYSSPSGRQFVFLVPCAGFRARNSEVSPQRWSLKSITRVTFPDGREIWSGSIASRWRLFHAAFISFDAWPRRSTVRRLTFRPPPIAETRSGLLPASAVESSVYRPLQTFIAPDTFLASFPFRELAANGAPLNYRFWLRRYRRSLCAGSLFREVPAETFAPFCCPVKCFSNGCSIIVTIP